MPHRVIICGSRGWTDRDRIIDRLADLPGDTVIVEGEARGADRIARQEGQKLGLIIEPHEAKWSEHGELSGPVPCSCPPEKEVCKLAGFRRNEVMASLGADLLIAFWIPPSAGTMDMMERCAKYGIPVEVQHRDFPNRQRRLELDE